MRKERIRTRMPWMEYDRWTADEVSEHPVWGKVVRISPRSFADGERCGFVLGCGVGFACGLVVGVLMMLARIG